MKTYKNYNGVAEEIILSNEKDKVEDAFVENVEKQIKKWLNLAPLLTVEAIEGPLQNAGYRINKMV